MKTHERLELLHPYQLFGCYCDNEDLMDLHGLDDFCNNCVSGKVEDYEVKWILSKDAKIFFGVEFELPVSDKRISVNTHRENVWIYNPETHREEIQDLDSEWCRWINDYWLDHYIGPQETFFGSDGEFYETKFREWVSENEHVIL